MKQLTQKLKKGRIEIRELSLPMLPAGHIIVRNHYSLISAGTESSTVATARKSLIGKAKARPQQAKQVLDVLKTQGPTQTYRIIMKKLDAYSPLGYSCAGEVVDIAADVKDFHIGDIVACAGITASHAEYVSIPVNLAVRLSPKADMKAAAYNALGAIAMQGVRRAELSLGESCAVIGLGLIGQLTGMLLKASGITVYGIDIDPGAISRTGKDVCDAAWVRKTPGLAEKIEQATHGLGVDAVIITAGTSSLDPVNFAGRICRKRGRVVIVGAVPTGFDRDPHYYRKELDLRMSCSYGPGRYDPSFEEKGVDYPPAYVRWTEKRNMEAFQRLIESGQVNAGELTSHVFEFEKAAEAYELILNRSEPFFGVLLAYDLDQEAEAPSVVPPSLEPREQNGLSFIGAGSYAQSFLLPNFKAINGITLRGVVTRSGTTSQRVADQYGFEYSSDDPQKILSDSSTHTVFIATRHDTHGPYVLSALENGKNIYVEKPLCITEDDLIKIAKAYEDTQGKQQLMVGFNRRFAPHVRKLKTQLSRMPMSVVYRINAGAIPSESWIQDVEIGGGRIIGEGCHFIDLITHLTSSLPKLIYASSMRNAGALEDTVSLTIEYENGSIGTVHYFANGAKALTKEHIEVFQDGNTYIIEDFIKSRWYLAGQKAKIDKAPNQNKGQAEMVKQFLEGLKNGKAAPISFPEIYAVMAASIAANISLRTHAPVKIKPIGPLT